MFLSSNSFGEQCFMPRHLNNWRIELTATIDGKVKIVTEASIRRHLQLADSNGISCFPNIEIFEQLSLMGYVSTSDKLTFKKDTFPLNGDFSSIPSYIGRSMERHPLVVSGFCWGGKDGFLEMDLFAFIQVTDPTKVKVREQERAEEEARLLDSIIRRVVRLPSVAPAHAESELEASVERLFDEGSSTDQGDSAAGGGQDAGTRLVTRVNIIVIENVTAERPKRLCKKRQAVTDASGSSHPPKKLKGDYETSGEVATSGKSPSVLKELLASSMLNVEAGVAAVATLPMVTSLVSATLEHESGAPADSIIGLNLRTIGASKRFVISSVSSHHSGINASGAKDDSIIRYAVVPPVMTEAVVTSHVVNVLSVPKTGTKVTSPVHASMFHDSDSTEMVKADVAEFVDHLAPPALFSQIREMDYHHLFTEFNIGTAHQACLNAEVRMRTEYCLSERKRLESECKKQVDLLKARDEEVENLKAQLLLKEIEAVEAAYLRAQVYAAEAMEKIHTNEIDALNRGMWLLKMRRSLLIGKSQSSNLRSGGKAGCRPSRNGSSLGGKEYLSSLGAAISRAIEKGMQDGLCRLSAGIDHGKAGRSLMDVVAYNPAAEVDDNSAIQRLREVDFPLLAELKSHKNASVEDTMNLLRLEGPLVDASGMNDFQPNVDQLMLPVHRSEDQVVLGETSLSFALSVTHSRVERIRENVAAKRSALIGVWTPLVNPLSIKNLVGEAGTFDSVPATIATITAMSTTFASASSIPPITIEDYKIVGTDGLEDAQGNVASFPIVEFEKEELDTTLERDPPS
ncbi:hypothetical protein Tco_0449452 [Tanacetum coccineum]